MRRSVSFIAVATAALVALSACGGDDDDGAAASSLPEATEPAPTSTEPTIAEPSDDAPTPTTAAPTVTDAPETTAAGAPTSAPVAAAPEAGDGDCLNGNWRAESTEMQRMLDAIGVAITMTIEPGSYWGVVIDDGSFVADSAVTLVAEIPGGGMVLSAEGGYHMEGTYTVDGDAIVAETVVREGTVGDWTATINGESVALPDTGTIMPPPSVGAPDFNGSTFTCNDTTLVFNVPGAPVPDITYSRV